MPLVEIQGLTISFGGQLALEGLSLAIQKGERFGIIGESGSGKSLTGLAIAGLLPEAADASGVVLLDGEPLPEDEKAMARLRGQRIGMVFQEPMTALNPLMRVGDQIEEALALTQADADISNLLQEVGLESGHARRFPHQLSGGQRQRVMIAMALANAPDLMIADEPTSALDVITQRTVLDLIRHICDRRQMTLIFISHDMRAVAALCDRVAVLRAGKLIETGPVANVLRAPASPYTQELVAATRMIPRQDGPHETGEVLLEIDGLGRAFQQGGFLAWRQPTLLAVDDVSFLVRRGECLALVGPSGCGKTTLARMIVGLDTASSGQMRLEGTAYHGSDLPPLLRADISLVFQDPFGSFNPRLTVGQSIGEPLRLLPRLATGEHEQRLVDAIVSVGLDPAMLSRYPHEFSGGQRQRLAIARALVTRPKLLVLDEPVSALDVSVRADVLDLLARLQQQFGLTYVIISHDLDMVAAMADRVLVMEKGRIVEEGTPAALFAQPRHPLTKALMAARLPDLAA
ncbi:peptide/nickel transport system ATP-binding protein [Devosia crocina]|uniref:Peptide/nickel transport system ATP-binding protein n=1 Tax=Devosia crocina TaxID=429728 RepID=A0A1I7NP84_9HYPH|nr:ABC transporter ATP-binding protein [Devosia crocina]SFV36482.1 peptide/nickel transport system ATP-binding protein [Devosia crocina]